MLRFNLNLILVNKNYKQLPNNTAHTFRSRDTADCLFEYRLTPQGNFSNMLLAFEKLMDEGKLTSTTDLRSLLHMSMIYRKYDDEIQSISPPQFVLNIMAYVARMIGYKL